MPRLPLSGGESLGVALALSLIALSAPLSALALRRRGPTRTSFAIASAVSAALMGASLVAFGPWWALHRGALGVSVEGPVVVRLAPSWSSPEVGSVESGVVLRLGDRFGAWVRVERIPEGPAGWVESAQLAPLDRPDAGAATVVSLPADSGSEPSSPAERTASARGAPPPRRGS